MLNWLGGSGSSRSPSPTLKPHTSKGLLGKLKLKRTNKDEHRRKWNMGTLNRTQAKTDAKVQKFEAFLEEKLKPDLLHLISQRDKDMEEQKTFSDLSKNIKLLDQQKLRKLKTLVNLGSEVYAQAEVPDTSRIFVNIGLGFHVEFTRPEALEFIAVKEASLARSITERTHQIANIKAQIKLVGEGIKELMDISGM